MKVQQFENVRLAIILSLLVILLGCSLGGIFGAYEDDIKAHLKSKALTVKESVYKDDQARLEKVSSKAWEYLKQAHTHAMGLGTVSLLLVILLSFFSVKPVVKYVVSLMIPIGALGYPLYWIMAACKAPLMGDTDATKESLGYIAEPSAGLLIIGLVLVIIISVYHFTKKK